MNPRHNNEVCFPSSVWGLILYNLTNQLLKYKFANRLKFNAVCSSATVSHFIPASPLPLSQTYENAPAAHLQLFTLIIYTCLSFISTLFHLLSVSSLWHITTHLKSYHGLLAFRIDGVSLHVNTAVKWLPDADLERIRDEKGDGERQTLMWF